MLDETIPILDVDIELTYFDDSTETVTLEAPNADEPFSLGFRRHNILPAYRDGNFTLQKGFEKYQVVINMDYASHRMNLFKLLASKQIAIKVPPIFSNDPANNYQKFTVFLENEEAIRNWLEDHAVGETDGATLEEVNPIPSGDASLTFVGVTPFTERQIRGDDPNPDDDDGRTIKFNQEPEIVGALYKVTGFKNSSVGWSSPFSLAGVIGSGNVFEVPDGTDFRTTMNFYRVVQASSGWPQSGGQDLVLSFRLGGDVLYEDIEVVEESPSCNTEDQIRATLAGGMDSWGLGNINSLSGNDNPNFRFYNASSTFGATLCYSEPFEFELYIRFVGVGSADIIINDEAEEDIQSIELIEEFTA